MQKSKHIGHMNVPAGIDNMHIARCMWIQLMMLVLLHGQLLDDAKCEMLLAKHASVAVCVTA